MNGLVAAPKDMAVLIMVRPRYKQTWYITNSSKHNLWHFPDRSNQLFCWWVVQVKYLPELLMYWSVRTDRMTPFTVIVLYKLGYNFSDIMHLFHALLVNSQNYCPRGVGIIPLNYFPRLLCRGKQFNGMVPVCLSGTRRRKLFWLLTK